MLCKRCVTFLEVTLRFGLTEHDPRPAQVGVQEWKARIAIRSREQPTSPSAPGSSDSRAIQTNTLAPHLCYVCHTTLTSKGVRAPPSLYASQPNPPASIMMPSWTTSGIIRDSLEAAVPSSIYQEDVPVTVSRKVLGQEELRKAIDEFILDD